VLPQLVLHIGAPKCGSSSIQHFLTRNRLALASQGCIVPDSNLELNGDFTGEQVWFFQQFKLEMGAGIERVRERVQALSRASDVSGVHTPHVAKIIISAENLSERQDFHQIFAGLKQQFDIRIIFYVRRQDEYLLAAWQQWHVKRAPDFWTWLLNNLTGKRKGDWLADIEPWLEEFGASSITVRRFGRQYFRDGDLLVDFADAAGLDSAGLDFDVPSQNEGLSDEALAFAHALQDVFETPHDNQFYAMLRAWGGPGSRKGADSGLLSAAQRRALLTHYEQCNSEIKRIWYPDPEIPETLFDPPGPAGGDSGAAPALNPEVALLMRLVYGAYQEIESLKSRS
jgi:hypothetical protein